MPTGRLRVVSLEKVEVEARDVKSFYFQDDVQVRPGQFYMVWIPGVDEVPMAVSLIGPLKGITVKRLGPSTTSLHKLKAGNRIGLRGPFGNVFDLEKEDYLLVAGGVGVASMITAGETLAAEGKHVVTAFGAKTRKELVLLDRVRMCGEAIVATEDGTEGLTGTASELVLQLTDKRRFDGVVACGPEKMLFAIATLCKEKGIDIQLSLERFMRCGIGLCGSCAMDGHLICVDGPVFRGDQLEGLRDFGEFRRDRAGRRVPI